MTFDEWWANNADDSNGTLSFREALCRQAWDAAVAAERERCCKILAGGDHPWWEHVAALREGKA